MGEAYWDILEQHGTNMCAERNIQLLSILLEPLANTFLTMSNIVYMRQFPSDRWAGWLLKYSNTLLKSPGR